MMLEKRLSWQRGSAKRATKEEVGSPSSLSSPRSRLHPPPSLDRRAFAPRTPVSPAGRGGAGRGRTVTFRKEQMVSRLVRVGCVDPSTSMFVISPNRVDLTACRAARPLRIFWIDVALLFLEAASALRGAASVREVALKGVLSGVKTLLVSSSHISSTGQYASSSRQLSPLLPLPPSEV